MNLSKKVKTKLISAFLIVAVLIFIVGTVGIISLGGVNKSATEMYDINLQSINKVLSVKSNMSEIKSNVLIVMNEENKLEVEEAKKNIDILVDEDNKYIEEYEKLISTSEEKAVWEKFRNNVISYRNARDGIINASNSNNHEEEKKQYILFVPVERAMFESLDDVIEINLNSASLAKENIDKTAVNTNIIMIIIGLVGVIIAVVLGLIIAENINKPLKKMKEYAERLALYDFSTPIVITRKDEFAQTALALNKAQENVNKLVRKIAENAQDMSASSEELSATAEELTSKVVSIDGAIKEIAGGMQESSAASEEISASVEEVNSSINELSEKAMEGSNSANSSKERAKEVQTNSKKAIDETLELYNEKQNKMLQVIANRKIVDSIKVMADTIGSIAEQTNLLALNAAIEAARAGEGGKGFAVVAEEVRNLAEQSSDSVTAIQETINKVKEAFSNSIDTGNDILHFINTSVNEQFNAYGETGNKYYNDSDFVSRMSEEIAAMSEEITATVGQVSDVIQDMAETALKSNEQVDTIKESMDETTKAIEQVALTAQSQAELAQNLSEMVQKFKI